MKMKQALACAMMALVAGCGGGGQQPSNAEVDDTAMNATVGVASAGEMAREGDSAKTAPVDRQNNDEENLDAGIFARKSQTFYSPKALWGEWTKGTLHELYFADSTGLQWDTSDDVSRDEAQRFSWTLDKNHLRQIFTMQLGGIVPRDYTVTFVDDESLVYKDDFDVVFMWDRP